jgi:periplasmic copper chaperone A
MIRSLLVATLAAAAITPAIAHITLESSEAQVGAGYEAMRHARHGCGESPTTAIRVKIPEGVIGVKPMPKPAWTLTTATGKVPQDVQAF